MSSSHFSIIACASSACQMSMETNDNPSAQRSPLLDGHPFQPSSFEFLADWEIRELILRLEAEQRRREQARWQEAERVRRENPRPCFHLCAYCQRFCTHKSRSIGEHQQHMRDQWHRCCPLVVLATAGDVKPGLTVQFSLSLSSGAVFTAIPDFLQLLKQGCFLSFCVWTLTCQVVLHHVHVRSPFR